MWKSSSFLLLFSLIIAKTLVFVFLLPPWQGPDEPFHFKMAYVIADPLINIRKLDEKIVKSLQQYRFEEYSDDTQKNDEILKLNTSKLRGYYEILGFLFKSFSGLTLIGKMFLGRFLSASCYLVIVLLVYGISRKIFSEDEGHWLSVAAVSFVGFQPQYSFFSITLNSDNLISLLLTIILCCMVFMASREQDVGQSGMRKCWPWLVAILALLIALLVKRTGIVGFFLFCLCIPMVTYKRRRSLIKAGLVALVLLALFSCFVFLSGLEKERGSKYLNQCSINFKGIPGALKVSYQAFDIDSNYEVMVLLNGRKVGNVKETKNDEWGPSRSVILPDELVMDDTRNVLTFDNVYNPPRSYSWGVRHIQIGDILEVKEPHGNIPQSKMVQDLTPEKRRNFPEDYEPSIVEKWSITLGKSAGTGLAKARDAFGVPPYLIVRFLLVQFVSFWFSIGWMIYKMSLGWYVLFGLITLLSLSGLIRLSYDKFRNGRFEFVNMKVVYSLILLFSISQAAMLIAYGPFPDSSINIAMGRCRFMEIGAVSVLIPLGLWAISPARNRDIIMRFFVCFMIFLNAVSVLKYMIPIFYL